MQWLKACAVALCGASVVMGAVTAHGVDAAAANALETAVAYQMWHGLAILTLLYVLAESHMRSFGLFSLLLGTVLFSGSLYLRFLFGIQSIAWLTPVGGSILIFAWLGCLLAVFRGNE